jgi:nucleoside 2-deoxyribosyltransferase
VSNGTRFVNRPLVYLASPYSRPDPVANTNRVVLAATAMCQAGHVTPVVPHLTMLWHSIAPQDLEFWYEYDLAVLARCDALLRMPGESTGADAEVAFAIERGIPTFDDEAAVNDWARDWE